MKLRMELLKIFTEYKWNGTMEWTANNTQEHMRAEMRNT